MSVIVITGASSGVGEACSLHFANLGFTVCAIARRKEKLIELVKEDPGHIEAWPLDVSDSSMVFSVFKDIEKKHGPIDVLVNNASVHRVGDYALEDIDTINEVIDIDLKGTMFCTRAALPGMIRRGDGRVINIASTAAINPAPGRCLYSTAKSAVVGFGNALAREMIPHGILVMTLCPGGIATPLWNEQVNPYKGDYELLMKPEEIAELLDFIIRQPSRTLFKQMVFFPISEWHS